MKFAPPHLLDEDKAAVLAVLDSGWVTTGPVAAELEAGLAALSGTPGAKVLNSGTAALELGLIALGVGPGDEVVTSAYTYAATAHAITRRGATPVLVDVVPGSYAIDPEAVRAALTPATRAVVPVDIGGVPCDLAALRSVLEEESGDFRPRSPQQEALGRVGVLADAAHSLGAERDGGPAAALADLTAFSFHAVKNLTTAEGGALTWSHEVASARPDLHRWASTMAVHGQDRDALAKTRQGGWRYDVTMVGQKWNMPDVLAALGLSQLRRYPASIATRHGLVERYEQAIADRGLRVRTLAHRGDSFVSSAHLMMVDLDGRGQAARDRVIASLEAAGVPANVHFTPLSELSVYADHGPARERTPHAWRAFTDEISLPLHTQLEEDDVVTVADALATALEEVDR